MLLAPNLGWRDVNLREPLAAALGVPVQIENSGKACALAQLWATRDGERARATSSTSRVSDGLGVGVVVGGELMRGQHNIAGEFGHVPLNIDGPRCGCGATGCWEAYVSNLATLSRYFGRDLRERPLAPEVAAFTVDDLIVRARGGDGKALAALLSTARYLGLGLGSVVNAHRSGARLHRRRNHRGLGSDRSRRCAAGARRARADAGRRRDPPIAIVPPEQYPRLRGAAALVAAPSFAGEGVAS